MGLFNPGSDKNDEIDFRGRKARYTHVITYWENEGGEPIFANQLVSNQGKIDVKGMIRQGLAPKVIFDAPDKII